MAKRTIEPYDPVAAFWSKVDATGDCWEWTGKRNRDGYGEHCFGGRSHRAHRRSWELLVGPIPDDLTLDHRCRVRHCVNPDHLEVVTQAVQVERRAFNGGGAYQRAKTHCKHGHPFDEANTYVYANGRRSCRACNRKHAVRRYWKLKELV